MSARVFDFYAFIAARFDGKSRSAATHVAEAKAARDIRRRARADEISAKCSAAGKLGAAAARGKPRHCALCRSAGHYRNACPRKQETCHG
jgi:hypothetical protein